MLYLHFTDSTSLLLLDSFLVFRTLTVKTIVIGDIHGCHSSLTALLEQVAHLADTIVFLGDYVNRGPHSKDVLATIIALQQNHPRVIPLMGNHERMFLNYIEGLESSTFLHAGGYETLKSYHIPTETNPEHRKNKIPTNHRRFLQSLPLKWEDQHAIYVHAGFQPKRHLSQQTSQWCLWVRDKFIKSTYDFGKPVIFGHTVFPKPHITDTKIGIDTGAVYGGQLTALLLPDKEFFTAPGEKKRPYPSSPGIKIR